LFESLEGVAVRSTDAVSDEEDGSFVDWNTVEGFDVGGSF
jgi:hypothetical protein